MKRGILVLSLCFLLIFSCVLAAVPRFKTAFSALGQTSESPVVILDAGHGGEDGGALSSTGNKESDMNLSIVLKLESLMAFLGVETVLTRSEDISIHAEGCKTLHEKKVSDLNNRAELIARYPNAMVISVHQNTFTDPGVHGAQVFYNPGDISAQWGSITQEMLRSVLDPDNYRNASGIPDHVYLFKKIECPAILVECGFLSNGEEVSLLLTDTYQRKIVLAITGAYIQQLQMIPTILGGE